jgi:hypothetical protein
MSYTVIASARIDVNGLSNNTKTFYKLPETSFGTSVAPIYPYHFSSRIDQGETEIIDLTSFGYSKVRVLMVKASRFVTLVLNTANDTYTLPRGTYFLQILDSGTDPLDAVNSIEIQVPSILGADPPSKPERYPNALVDVFLAVEDA